MLVCASRRKPRRRKFKPVDPGYQYVLDHWDQLWSLCRRLCRKGREDLVEELFSDVIVGQVPSIVNRWDRRHGQPLKVWVDYSVRRYVCKWFMAKAKRDARYEDLPEERFCVVTDEFLGTDPVPSLMEERDGLHALLGLLTKKDRRLLRMKFIRGFTHLEIGDVMGWCESRVCDEVRKAIVRARKAAMDAALQRSAAYRARREPQ